MLCQHSLPFLQKESSFHCHQQARFNKEKLQRQSVRWQLVTEVIILTGAEDPTNCVRYIVAADT